MDNWNWASFPEIGSGHDLIDLHDLIEPIILEMLLPYVITANNMDPISVNYSSMTLSCNQ